MAKLIILCGLPGAGKSSYAEQLLSEWTIFEDVDAVIHSSDAIRKELFGDAGSQEDNSRVFELMRKRVREDLRAGKNVIYDATNVTRKARKSAIACAHPTNDTIECHVVWAEPEECVRRDSLRERKVGPEVIDKMIRRWQSPWKDEGFDAVRVFLNQDDFNQVKYVAAKTSDMHIPHDNPHHQLGIWEHCMQTYANIVVDHKNNKYIDFNSLAAAALWHDIGKPYTKFFKPGETVAHYYDHHCVGGYLVYGLFLNPKLMGILDKDKLCFISWIVANHMEGFFDSKYYKELLPQWKWYLEALHTADLAA
ncbi:MAG: AAA family ATPase, partial [Lachnospiraceae bacterium]|nr:AAA family ATPase [Lachnospiraceae bacterium]